MGNVGKAVTNPLPLALLSAWLSGLGWLGAVALAAALTCRLVLQRQVDHTLRVSTGPWWLGRARLPAFVVHVRADGTLVPVVESKA